jgi:hypothetical protein
VSSGLRGRSVAIIGAGPIGLEAAARFSEAGAAVTVLEQGLVGDAVSAWGHVRLFSPWKMNCGPSGLRLLGALPAEGEAFPTGASLVRDYLQPLAAALRLRGVEVVEKAPVVAIGRQSLLKGEAIGAVGDRRREQATFRLIVDGPSSERALSADIVVDATGTWSQPNWLGRGGLPAPGERLAAAYLARRLPDINGAARKRFDFGRVAVVGGGYSAATAIAALLDLRQAGGTAELHWVLRDAAPSYARYENDPLAGRDALSARMNEVLRGEAGVTIHAGYEVEALSISAERVNLSLTDAAGAERALPACSEVICATGYRPDLELCRELQVHLCYASEGPMKLAAAMLAAGGAGGDCLAQESPGAEVLRSPEPNFFVVGAKSYGRGSAFLLGMGYEQAEQVVGLCGG